MHPQRDLMGFAKTPFIHGESTSEGWWKPHESIAFRLEWTTCGLRMKEVELMKDSVFQMVSPFFI